MEQYEAGDMPVTTIVRCLEHEFDLGEGTGISVFKMLICEKKITLDLNEEINLTRLGKQEFYGQHLYQ